MIERLEDRMLLAGADTANVDNDPKETEVLAEDKSVPGTASYGKDLDGDNDPDVVVVGTQGGEKVIAAANLDNDPNDTEVLVKGQPPPAFGMAHPRPRSVYVIPNQSVGKDLDADGDPDLVLVGTCAPAAELVVVGVTNIDNDPNDEELIVRDPYQERGIHSVDVDGDGDPDVVVLAGIIHGHIPTRCVSEAIGTPWPRLRVGFV